VAALATIDKMEKHDVQSKLVAFGNRINEGWINLAKKHGLELKIDGIPPLTHYSFSCDEPLAAQTFYAQEMLEKGYLLGAAVYMSLAYTEEIIDDFINASDSVFSNLKDMIDSDDIRKHLKFDIIHSGFKRLA
jgi:glutamate-1-semialdehyde 2,1-aminomutase